MKILLILLATVVGLLAALFGLASGVSHGSSDPIERLYAARSAFWSALIFMLCAGLIVSLTGCAGGSALYHACRDGLCR